MSVGQSGPQLRLDLLQYVGCASRSFVVDLVHAIGFLDFVNPNSSKRAKKFPVFSKGISLS